MGRFKIKEDGVWRKIAWKDEVDGLAGNGRTTETVKGNADKIGILNGIGEVKEKINVANIVDDLTTNDSAKVLSAKQGKILKDELTSHIDDDDNPHEVKAKQIEYDNTESELATTTVQGAIDEVNANLASHKAENMPHQFINHKENKTYKFGFQLSAEGNPQIIFEEVV